VVINYHCLDFPSSILYNILDQIISKEAAMYPAITPQRKKGDEPFLSPDGKTVAQLMDF
jgi:hypothetical protein